MKFGLHQSARLEQRLLQSPQMIQAMQILQLPALDLADRVQQELMENPFLELKEATAEGEGEHEREREGDRERDGEREAEGAREREAEGARERDGERGGEAAGASEDGGEGAREADEQLIDRVQDAAYDWDESGRGRRAQGEIDAGEKKLEALANMPEAAKSLPEVLIDELAILDLSDRQRALAEYLLWSLDERGYLPETLEQVAQECNHPEDPHEPPLAGPGEPEVTAAELAQALERIREISHPALGARDLTECLLLQVATLDIPDRELLAAIVTGHLEDVQHNRLPRIAKATGRDMEQVKDALELLRRLDPQPGAGFGDVRADVIHPEVIVEEIDGQYEVRLDRSRAPQLTLSPAWKEFMQAAKKTGSGREWIRKRLESARWFLDALAQRQSTLERVATALFARQRAFLDRGVPGLVPLRMQEIADEVGVHISTVSRAASGKYAQTPRGILPLKFFFASGTATASGEMHSQASIKQKVRELVARENGATPLSDEELGAELERQLGVRIARRTVTKYRKALAIPSSSQRRRF